MEVFDDDFINELSDDPKVGLFEICEQYLSLIDSPRFKFENYLEAYALAEAFIKANEMDIAMPPLSLKTGTHDETSEMVTNFFNAQLNGLRTYIESDKEERALQHYRGRFSTHISKSFAYEFSDGDLERMKGLTIQLKDLVHTSAYFEEKYQKRLLNRIEILQEKLHKRQANLDHFWGLVGDAGVVVGKLGTNAKPFVDRVKEITNIIWRIQARSEELPSDSKPALLFNDETKH